MPGRNKRAKPSAQFAVVQQSYEDPDAEDKPKPVLVPVSTKTHRPIKAVKFMEDMDDADIDMHRLNMRMADDDDEEHIFHDEVEEDFDQDFIRSMVTGEGVIDSDEEYDEFEDDEYPTHAERRPIESQFDRMMDDFEFDGEVDEDDPRAHGALDVMDYAPALEEFVQQEAGASYSHPDEAAKHKGFMHAMKALAMQHRVFDSNAAGHFVVALDPDKGRRIANNFAENNEGLKEITLQQLRQGLIDDTDVLHRDDADEKLVPLELPAKAERMDCETVLSTYTNVYNHPTVVAAQTKRMKLSVAAARQARQEGRAKHAEHESGAGKKSPAMGPAKIGPAGAPKPLVPAAKTEEEQMFDDLPDEALPSMMDLSNRPKDESKEEKALRRALVKELQRERRAEKKSTKTAYRGAEIAHAHADARQKLDKKTITMSVVRR